MESSRFVGGRAQTQALLRAPISHHFPPSQIQTAIAAAPSRPNAATAYKPSQNIICQPRVLDHDQTLGKISWEYHDASHK